MGSFLGFPVNALIVGWLAGNGIMLVVGVLLFTAADSWAQAGNVGVPCAGRTGRC